jgi:hypothetical protein
MATTTSTTTATPPARVVHALSARTSRPGDPFDGHDVRPVTLTAAAYLLGAPIADFDAVRVAAALDDLRCCPLCMRRSRSGRGDSMPRAS